MSLRCAIQEMGAKLKAAPWSRIVPLVLVGAASVFGYISIGYIVGHTQGFNQVLPFGHYLYYITYNNEHCFFKSKVFWDAGALCIKWYFLDQHCTNNGFLVPKKNSEVVSEGEDIFVCVSHDCFRR